MSTRTARASKLQNEKNAAILRELLKKPSNKKCADCKRNDPRWASWNLGIFVCIRCSGVHRSMGTHISKVKSIDLDTWTPEQIENMKRWGNFKANKYWEARLTPSEKFQENNFERWIRSKYEYKRFAAGDTIPDPSTLPNEDGDNSVVVSNSSIKNSVQPLLNTEEANGIFTKVEKSKSEELINTKNEDPPKDTQNIFFQDIMNSTTSVKNTSTVSTEGNVKKNSNQSSQVNSLKSSILSLYNTPPKQNSYMNQSNNSNINIGNNFAFSTATNTSTLQNNNYNNSNNILFTNNNYQSQSNSNSSSSINNISMPFYNKNTISQPNQLNNVSTKKSDPFDFVSISSFTNNTSSKNNISNSGNININKTSNSNTFNINTNTNANNNNNDEFSDFQTASAQSNNWANF